MLDALPTSPVPLVDAPCSAGCGVLLVGHGTRDEQGQAEFLLAAAMLQEAQGPTPVEACFLELAQPTIAEGVAGLAGHGARDIVVVPGLLFAAAHAKRDIPAQVADAAVKFPGMSWRMAEPLDCHRQILELSARRFREAITDPRELAPAETLLVMVGRGTSDSQAIAAMHQFTRERAALTPVAESLACFLTGAKPTLDEALARAAMSQWRNIVVQPHLLFHGQLIGEIHAAVARLHQNADSAEERLGARRWIVAAPLGPEPELVAALVDRLASAADVPRLQPGEW